VIGAQSNVDVIINARIYADTLSVPLTKQLRLHLDVRQISIPANEFMTDIIKPVLQKASPP
ncbi:MAG TPA: hypothetical protein VEF33_01015, partial [Syntrophales bacterium]|nr:hypothetical protein [Syntrophales bacterium]